MNAISMTSRVDDTVTTRDEVVAQEVLTAERRKVSESARSGRVVVGINGSPSGDAALEWAIAEAEATGSDLLACHAYLPQHIVRPGAPAAEAHTERQARRRLDTAAMAAARRLGSRRVAHELWLGDPASALVEAAHQSSMLVVGSHGDMGQSAGVVGSTALEVVARADCPVVVVRPLFTGRRGRFADHVVVGVDGTASSRPALRFAFEYASRHSLPLAAVHAAARWSGDVWSDDSDTDEVPDQASLRLLTTELNALRRRFPEVAVTQAVYGGTPVSALLRAGSGAKLLVVGSRRADGTNGAAEGGFGSAALGSVTRGVTGHAGCPVAVVRS